MSVFVFLVFRYLWLCVSNSMIEIEQETCMKLKFCCSDPGVLLTLNTSFLMKPDFYNGPKRSY